MYNGLLECSEGVRNHTLREEGSLSESLLLVDTTGCNMYESVDMKGVTESKYNVGEADLVLVIVEELLAEGVCASDIGVITPYNAQASLVKSVLRAGEDEAGEIMRKGRGAVEVSTVDGFQGREKEAIVISCVRSN